MSSEKGSKFGMLKNLTQPTDGNKAAKQENRKDEKQKQVEGPPTPELKHYSTYMPADLYTQLQVYVAKQKAVKGRGQERVSIQNVITEAVRVYLDKHDTDK